MWEENVNEKSFLFIWLLYRFKNKDINKKQKKKVCRKPFLHTHSPCLQEKGILAKT